MPRLSYSYNNGLIIYVAIPAIVLTVAITLLTKSINNPKIPQCNNLSSNSVCIEDFKFSFPVGNNSDRVMEISGKRLMPVSKNIGMFRTDAIKILRLTDAESVLYINEVPLTRIHSKSATLEPRDPIKGKGMDALTGTISFSGGVTVFTQDRNSLTCRKLELDQINGKIRAEGGCVMFCGGKRVKADMIDTDILLRDYSVRKGKKRPIDSMPFVAMFR